MHGFFPTSQTLQQVVHGPGLVLNVTSFHSDMLHALLTRHGVAFTCENLQIKLRTNFTFHRKDHGLVPYYYAKLIYS